MSSVSGCWACPAIRSLDDDDPEAGARLADGDDGWELRPGGGRVSGRDETGLARQREDGNHG